MNIALNNEQQRFVISTGNSVSCLGFQVVYAQACELARRLKLAAAKTCLANRVSALVAAIEPKKDQIGTLEQYEQYQSLLTGYAKLDDTATWFDARTPKKVQKVLETARKSGDLVRIFYGASLTGRDWLSVYDTIGHVGRSTGTMKVPLLVRDGELGGSALLTDCIVRIINLTTGEELFRHSTYHVPTMELQKAALYDQVDGYTHCVKVANNEGVLETQANFKSLAEAAHWLAFINGNSHDYPTNE